VSLNFAGEGKRNVRVGYVVENPIWKTSYRLVLDKANKASPLLQGWAVVENPTDEDWREVRMALVSGRPISFQMNLYDPLYVSRPVVEPELFASLRPVAYSGSLTRGADQLAFDVPKLDADDDRSNGVLGAAPDSKGEGKKADKSKDSLGRRSAQEYRGMA